VRKRDLHLVADATAGEGRSAGVHAENFLSVKKGRKKNRQRRERHGDLQKRGGKERISDNRILYW